MIDKTQDELHNSGGLPDFTLKPGISPTLSKAIEKAGREWLGMEEEHEKD